jgi:cytochrome c biogenesis protein CcmG, thiol:disulfide interchange protein DsbE
MHDNSQEPKEESKKPLRKRRTIIFLVVSLVNVGLLTVILVALLTPARNGSQANDPLIGHPAPNFTLAALNPGSQGLISLSDFKGKAVVLNVWSSTCAPCSEEAPLLKQQWQQVRDRGVVFLGIDFQDSQSGAQKFLQQYAVTYPNVSDMTGKTTLDYDVVGMPETLFINRQGIVISRVIGQLTPQALQSNLQAILS